MLPTSALGQLAFGRDPFGEPHCAPGNIAETPVTEGVASPQQRAFWPAKLGRLLRCQCLSNGSTQRRPEKREKSALHELSSTVAAVG